ncbi:metal-dependent hydrolase [Chloroflexota bacterium]
MSTTLKYFGISFFEIETQCSKILVDPCITTNRLCPIKVEDIARANLILVTHGAPDHMGDAIELQKTTKATLVCGPGVKVHALTHGVEPDKIITMLWGDLVEVGGIKIQAVECRHASFFLSKDIYISGLPLSFIIYPEEGTRIYNVGDSALFSDMKLISELYRPNVALIPVGGSPDLTGGWAHLPPREASLCAHWVSPEVAIPAHYDPKSTDGDQFVEKVRELSPTVKVVILEPGESYTFNPNK